MNEEKVLTKEIASKYRENNSSVKLAEFQSIDREAAKRLVSYRTRELDLSGLVELPDTAAKALSGFSGRQ